MKEKSFAGNEEINMLMDFRSISASESNSKVLKVRMFLLMGPTCVDLSQPLSSLPLQNLVRTVVGSKLKFQMEGISLQFMTARIKNN